MLPRIVLVALWQVRSHYRKCTAHTELFLSAWGCHTLSEGFEPPNRKIRNFVPYPIWLTQHYWLAVTMPVRPSFTAPTVNNLGQVVVYDTNESRMADSNCPLFFRRELFYPNKLIRHQSESSHVLTIRLNHSHTIGLLTPKHSFFGRCNHHRLLYPRRDLHSHTFQ